MKIVNVPPLVDGEIDHQISQSLDLVPSYKKEKQGLVRYQAQTLLDNGLADV